MNCGADIANILEAEVGMKQGSTGARGWEWTNWTPQR